MPHRILLTGADGFTGQHFVGMAREYGHEIVPLGVDLTDGPAVEAKVSEQDFDCVVHLAAVSAVTHGDVDEIYRVNLFGTLNLLSAVEASAQSVDKVLVASSANVYGNSPQSPISETVCPDPVNHYAMSKLAMEKMALSHFGSLPLVFVRPFNYTGVGHDNRFVIPKIIEHFAESSPTLELGNIFVEREFNDVRAVCRAYLGLITSGVPGEIYNFCSGVTHSLEDVIDTLKSITGHEIAVVVNQDYVRDNEVDRLMGDPAKLQSCIGPLQHTPLPSLLKWMFDAAALR